LLQTGEVIHRPELADALERLGAEGPDPFYTGDIGAAVVEWVSARSGMVTAQDLGAYEVIDRQPIKVHYRGREVTTNPLPSAGGILIARALSLLDADGVPPNVERTV